MFYNSELWLPQQIVAYAQMTFFHDTVSVLSVFSTGISEPFTTLITWHKRWSGRAIELGNFQYRGVLLIRILVGLWPMLAVGDGDFDKFPSSLSCLFSFSLSLGDGLIQSEVLYQRASKPKIFNLGHIESLTFY